MPFDVEKMVPYCEASIEAFAKEHQDETFYAFAIDEAMLCLNSLERFEIMLKEYQDSWDRRTRPIKSPNDMTEEDWRDEDFLLGLKEEFYGLDRSDKQACIAVINASREERRQEGCEFRTSEGILKLKMNTGDWDYQGFDDLYEEHGFDWDLYDDHCKAAPLPEDAHAPYTDYAKAMTALVQKLVERKAFRSLNLTDDFTATWGDHIYR